MIETTNQITYNITIIFHEYSMNYSPIIPTMLPLLMLKSTIFTSHEYPILWNLVIWHYDHHIKSLKFHKQGFTEKIRGHNPW